MTFCRIKTTILYPGISEKGLHYRKGYMTSMKNKNLIAILRLLLEGGRKAGKSK
jgi:hypothetical protein